MRSQRNCAMMRCASRSLDERVAARKPHASKNAATMTASWKISVSSTSHETARSLKRCNQSERCMASARCNGRPSTKAQLAQFYADKTAKRSYLHVHLPGGQGGPRPPSARHPSGKEKAPRGGGHGAFGLRAQRGWGATHPQGRGDCSLDCENTRRVPAFLDRRGFHL